MFPNLAYMRNNIRIRPLSNFAWQFILGVPVQAPSQFASDFLSKNRSNCVLCRRISSHILPGHCCKLLITSLLSHTSSGPSFAVGRAKMSSWGSSLLQVLSSLCNSQTPSGKEDLPSPGLETYLHSDGASVEKKQNDSFTCLFQLGAVIGVHSTQGVVNKQDWIYVFIENK